MPTRVTIAEFAIQSHNNDSKGTSKPVIITIIIDCLHSYKCWPTSKQCQTVSACQVHPINFINIINHINYNDINMAAGFTGQSSITVSRLTTSVRLQSALLGDTESSREQSNNPWHRLIEGSLLLAAVQIHLHPFAATLIFPTDSSETSSAQIHKLHTTLNTRLFYHTHRL